jgi:flagellar motor component MotA
MHSSQERIAQWRAALSRSGAFGAWQLDELEDHLQLEIKCLIQGGLAPDAAHDRALLAVGSVASLSTEYDKLNRMKPLVKLSGLSLLLGIPVLAVMSSGTTLGIFIHLPSMLLVLGLVGAGLLLGFGPIRVGRAFRESISADPECSPEELNELVEVFSRGARIAWGSGVVGVILGIISMLQNLSDPSQLGQGAALALLSLLYGAVLAELVFSNLRQWLAGRVLASAA